MSHPLLHMPYDGFVLPHVPIAYVVCVSVGMYVCVCGFCGCIWVSVCSLYECGALSCPSHWLMSTCTVADTVIFNNVMGLLVSLLYSPRSSFNIDTCPQRRKVYIWCKCHCTSTHLGIFASVVMTCIVWTWTFGIMRKDDVQIRSKLLKYGNHWSVFILLLHYTC